MQSPKKEQGEIKDFLNDQRKELEQNNGMGKTRDLFKKIKGTTGTFHTKMGKMKDRWYGPERSRRYQEEVARIHRRTIQKRSSRPR